MYTIATMDDTIDATFVVATIPYLIALSVGETKSSSAVTFGTIHFNPNKKSQPREGWLVGS